MRFPLIYLSPRCRLFLLVFPAVCGVLPSVPLAGQAVYLDASAPVEDRVADLLSRMTLDEKIGQMTQANIGSVAPHTDIRDYYLGSLLSGGGEAPSRNTAEAWADMVDGYQAQALTTRLQIPLLYGVNDLPLARITVTTVPGYFYEIEFSDDGPDNASPWNTFANPANGIGTWTETGSAASTFPFQDDFSPATSGYPSPSGMRFYRVTSSDPAD